MFSSQSILLAKIGGRRRCMRQNGESNPENLAYPSKLFGDKGNGWKTKDQLGMTLLKSITKLGVEGGNFYVATKEGGCSCLLSHHNVSEVQCII